MWFNPIILSVLYSPFHKIISDNTLVVLYTGRKSGKKYRVPVGYVRMDESLMVLSFKTRTWWRNMRGGADVTLHIAGKDVNAHADVIEDDQGVMEVIRSFIAMNPLWANRMGIKKYPDSTLDEDSLQFAANKRLIVRFKLI